MNRIKQLLAELCPDGVEFRALGEVAGYSDTRIDAKSINETNFVGVDNLIADKRGKVNSKYLPTDIRLTKYERGDILLGNIRPYLKKIWLAQNPGGCSGDVLTVRISGEYGDRIKPEFLYYLLSSDKFFIYNTKHAKGGKMPRGDKARILEYEIPVPPIAIQNEIAKILDKFVELQTELQARKIQYHYYRNVLFTFPSSENEPVFLGCVNCWMNVAKKV